MSTRLAIAAVGAVIAWIAATVWVVAVAWRDSK
jgi:hypothetical protein